MSELSDLQFCHLVVGVTDMDRALSFYRSLLGMDVVFDRLISAAVRFRSGDRLATDPQRVCAASLPARMT